MRAHRQHNAERRASADGPAQARDPGQACAQVPFLEVGGPSGEGDLVPLGKGRAVRRGGDGHRRNSVGWRFAVLHVQQWCRRRDSVVRLRCPLTHPADDDHHRVATRPSRPVYDLLDDRGDIGRPLIGARFAHRRPRDRRPRHGRRRPDPRGDVPAVDGEGEGIVMRLPLDGQIGRLRGGLVHLKLDVGVDDRRP